MGGWGTWSHGIKYPEIWTAIALCVGGIERDRKIVEQISNLKGKPVLIWCGKNDPAFDDALLMISQLENLNIPYVLKLIEGRGHEFRNDDRHFIYEWLLNL